MKPDPKRVEESFRKLVEVVARLRDPNGGCPWDLEQTHETLTPYIIEEAYEVIEAINGDRESLPKELGDLLLQVVLHAQVATDEKTFSIVEVCDSITAKLIKRHPHVFGDVEAKTAGQVLKNWEKIKQEELKENQSILDGVPKGMPALLRAQRVGEKAARVGFEWNTVDEVKAKVLEEVSEFIECSKGKDTADETMKDEFGDILFALTQLSRRLNLQSEELLHQSIDKFSRRFKEMEKRAKKPLSDYSLSELDEIWEDIKRDERASSAKSG